MVYGGMVILCEWAKILNEKLALPDKRDSIGTCTSDRYGFLSISFGEYAESRKGELISPD